MYKYDKKVSNIKKNHTTKANDFVFIKERNFITTSLLTSELTKHSTNELIESN